MLTIVRCDNRLSERSLEEPAFLYPIKLKGRIDTFEMRQKLLQDFLLAQLEEGIIHRSIVAKINEVLSSILRRRLVIGMLNQTGKRVTWIAWIDPIAIGKLASQGEDETLRTICLTPIITSTIIIWQRWYEATGKPGRHSGNYTVSRPGSLAGMDLPTSIIQRFNLFHTGAE